MTNSPDLQEQVDFLAKENALLGEQVTSLVDSIRSFDKLCNLRGWAIDRAVSIYQINRNADSFPSAQEVIKLAEQLAQYAYGADFIGMNEEAKKLGETIQ